MLKKMNIIESRKNSPKWFLSLISLLFLGLLFTFTTVHAESGDYSKIYHVYLDNEHIGSVSSKDTIEGFIEEQINAREQKLNGLNLTINESVKFVPEFSFQPTYNNNKVIDRLSKSLTYSVQATKLEIKGKVIGYFKNQEMAEQVLTALKAKYVPKELLEGQNSQTTKLFEALSMSEEDNFIINKFQSNVIRSNAVDNQFEIQALTLSNNDTSNISEVKLSDEAIFEEEKVDPSDINTIEEGLKVLEELKLEPTTYIVQQGDVLSTIAQKFNLTEKKLLELNPLLDNSDSILHIGQELIVQQYQPFVDVIVIEEEAMERDIAFNTEYVKSDDLYQGEQKLVQEGKDGKMKVHYEIIKVNGEESERHIVDEEILVQPVPKIIAKGTKLMPSRSPGALRWPTYGGVITSYMGPRWGSYHKGIDIAGVSNRTIYAAEAGIIKSAGNNWDGYGNRIEINHGDGLETTYSHLASIYVVPGQRVQKGEAIGLMGTTGNSTGIHLHFEVFVNGRVVNPLRYY